MKNIIDMLLNLNDSKTPEKTPEEILKESCAASAVKYAGLEPADVTVDSAVFESDDTGSWCVVTLRDAGEKFSRCKMTFTAYVDVYTGEVAGFSGQADMTWLDRPSALDGASYANTENVLLEKAA